MNKSAIDALAVKVFVPFMPSIANASWYLICVNLEKVVHFFREAFLSNYPFMIAGPFTTISPQ
jgi:hypothetical protein